MLIKSIHFFALLFILSACSVQNQIHKAAQSGVLGDSALKHAHIGISIYDASANKYLYEHNGSSYFIPASNVKIITCYAAMKYLGDSLTGIRYVRKPNGILLLPAADPTFLFPGFAQQPVVDFIKNEAGPFYITNKQWYSDALGSGWSWNDYNFYYSTERNALPVYGNNIRWIQELEEKAMQDSTAPDPSAIIYSIPEVNWEVRFSPDENAKNFYVQRHKDENIFTITEGREKRKEQWVPFVTNGIQSAIELLKDTTGKYIQLTDQVPLPEELVNKIASCPTDSALKPMMHQSDNFFAEQVLQMVSYAVMGKFSDDLVIDSLMKTDFRNLPQRPYWADGSGLSRYNLFTPRDFISVLGKMKEEFGMERVKAIFPTGGEGTLRNYFKNDSSFIFAKTGSLSGVVALSGYLYTRKGKLLLFSTIINNHRSSPTAIRRGIEALLVKIRQKY